MNSILFLKKGLSLVSRIKEENNKRKLYWYYDPSPAPYPNYNHLYNHTFNQNLECLN